MRLWPLAALLVLACVPPAQAAASSSIALDAPGVVRADKATTVDLRATLLLDGVVCTSPANVPVSLRIAEQTGMRSAQLALEDIGFRLQGTEAATRPWRGEAVVPLTLWTDAASGLVRVTASYALPSQCLAPGGATSGSTSVTIRVDGPASAEAPAPPQPAAPRAEATLAQNGASAPQQAARTSLPLPVVGAIVGTAVGGLVVAVKRLRPRAA